MKVLSNSDAPKAWQPPELEQVSPRAAESATGGEHENDQAMLEQQRQAGFAEGYARGEAQGRQAGEQRAAQSVADMAQLWSAMAAPYRLQSDRLIEEMEGLVTKMVSEVVRAESLSQPELINAVLLEVTEDLRQATGAVEIYLHPQDKVTVEHFLADLEPLAATVSLLEDAELLRGGCRIAAKEWFIDATLERRIADCVNQLSAPGGDTTEEQD